MESSQLTILKEVLHLQKSHVRMEMKDIWKIHIFQQPTVTINLMLSKIHILNDKVAFINSNHSFLVSNLMSIFGKRLSQNNHEMPSIICSWLYRMKSANDVIEDNETQIQVSHTHTPINEQR